MADGQLSKKLLIKTSAIKRIQKEYFAYQQEEAVQNQKIENLMLNPNHTESSLNKQIEILNDTKQMFPNVLQRLDEAVKDLTNYLSQNDAELNEEQKSEAINLINQTTSFLAEFNSAHQ